MGLEAETGSGKTEAAIVRFAALFAAGEVDGLYFALPTRTAATQIHERVVAATKRMFPNADERPAVVLAVPGYLRADDTDGLRLPRFEVLWPDDGDQRQRHRRWAAEAAKRYLAGVIVVGTIDQALLSTLMVNHAHLRATALLRHLLVIDEVHASDTYMTRLTESVLARHTKAGGHAFLMSATLGSTARAQLLHPENKVRTSSLLDAIEVPYPLVTHRNALGEVSRVLLDDADATSPKQVSFLLHGEADDSSAIARRGLEAALDGAKVLILRNTVKDCVATQIALETLASKAHRDHLFQCRGHLTPHHARYAAVDRKLLDEAVGRAFGKHRSDGGRVAVATQTVQQSLDLDADLLITDLCPMDVLLQRVGRLHRHTRSRPEAFSRARCVVLTPGDRDLSCFLGSQRRKRKKDSASRETHGLGTVYDDLRIIEATWRVLLAHPEISIPNENRQLVEATVHPDALERIVDDLGPAWKNEQTHSFGKRAADRSAARLNLVSWDIPFDGDEMLFPSQQTYSADGDVAGQRIATRLGEGDRRAELPHPVKGPFGESIEVLSIPAHLARGIPDEESVSKLVSDERHLAFSFGAARYRYDRFGLQRLSTTNLKED